MRNIGGELRGRVPRGQRYCLCEIFVVKIGEKNLFSLCVKEEEESESDS